MIALKLDFPAKTLMEFVDYAKTNPGKVSLGHAGVGSSNYLICRQLHQGGRRRRRAGQLSRRGSGVERPDGRADRRRLRRGDLASGAVQGAKVKALVVATPSRLASLPDVPTSGRGRPAGLPGPGLERALRAEGNARADHRQAESRLCAQRFRARTLQSSIQGAFLGAAGERMSSRRPMSAAMVPGEIEKYKMLLQDK